MCQHEYCTPATICRRALKGLHRSRLVRKHPARARATAAWSERGRRRATVVPRAGAAGRSASASALSQIADVRRHLLRRRRRSSAGRAGALAGAHPGHRLADGSRKAAQRHLADATRDEARRWTTQWSVPSAAMAVRPHGERRCPARHRQACTSCGLLCSPPSCSSRRRSVLRVSRLRRAVSLSPDHMRPDALARRACAALLLAVLVAAACPRWLHGTTAPWTPLR